MNLDPIASVAVSIEIDRFKKVLLDGTDGEAAKAFQTLSPPVKAFFEQCLSVRMIKQFSKV
jgi:hypothetical protein